MAPRIKFKPSREPGVDIAIAAAGSMTALGKGLGLTRNAITMWTKVPAEHALAIERLFGAARWELRPDLYPPPVPVVRTGRRGRPRPRKP
jgi:DNA-binding transcriptional regulator YdaS (Cro superfamily)